MSRLSLQLVEPGMRLSSAVYNLHGNLLLGEGVELTQRHISLLKSWGINEVEVCYEEEKSNGENGPDEEPDAQSLQLIEEALDRKFSEVLDGEVMMEIMRVSRKHAVQRSLSQLVEVEENASP